MKIGNVERFIYKLPLFIHMKIGKEDVLRINKGFGGGLRNDSSLDFALDMQNSRKFGPYKKLAYLFRAILVDHPFSDGNKRTATFIALAFADENNKRVNTDLLTHHIISIAKHNIIDIRQIERRLKDAIG
jgi:prophage maintenance system killer protein